MANTSINILPYTKASAGVLSCVRQEKWFIPSDLSVDTETYIPICRFPWKYSVNNTDFSGVGKNPTIPILVSRGFKINTIYAMYTIPAQYAKQMTDEIEYDSLPGVHCLTQIEASIGGSTQIETVTPLAIIQRYIDFYGLERFKKIATQWLGGYKDRDHCDPNQKKSGTKYSSISADNSKNIIKEAIPITLPIPACLLFNKEKYNFFLSQETPLEFKFIFKQIQNFTSRTVDTVLSELAGTIDIYMEYLNPCEFGNFFTGLPYSSITNEDYYFRDFYYEQFTKSFTTTQEMKMYIKPAITYQLRTFVMPKDWNSGQQYFGTTVQEAAKNLIGSCIVPSSQDTNANYTFNIGTGLFVGTNSNISGSLSITGWSATGLSFALKWLRNNSQISQVLIHCTSPLGSFGDLFFDLSTFSPNLLLPTFNSNSIISPIFYFKEFTLVIQPYDNSLTDVSNVEIPTITYASAKKLARGYFTFHPSAQGVNQTAFWSVINMSPSELLAPAEFAFDYFMSQPVPTQNSANNTLAAKNFVIVNKNCHQFYDLDCKWPIEVDSIIYEKQGSNNEQLFPQDLVLWRDALAPEHRWRAQIEINYGYKDLNDVNKNSFGYMDFRTLEVLDYTVKLKTVKIQYNNVDLTDTLKDMSNNQKEVEIVSLQSALRTLKYSSDLKIMYVNDDEKEQINHKLLDEILKPAGIYEDAKSFNANMVDHSGATSRGRKRPIDQTSRSYYQRANAISPDPYSLNNKFLKPTLGPAPGDRSRAATSKYLKYNN